jgi:hypothetical protein
MRTLIGLIVIFEIAWNGALFGSWWTSIDNEADAGLQAIMVGVSWIGWIALAILIPIAFP